MTGTKRMWLAIPIAVMLVVALVVLVFGIIALATSKVSTSGKGILSLETGTHLAATPSITEPTESIDTLIKGIYLDDGIRVETSIGASFVRTETEILMMYELSDDTKLAEETLVYELEEHLGGKYDIMIGIRSLVPLELEVHISKKEME